MSDWRPINAPPDKPSKVIFYLANAEWRHYQTDEVVEIPDLEAMRYEIGYWDGERWREQCTNHDLAEERGAVGDEAFPTHWKLLDAPSE